MEIYNFDNPNFDYIFLGTDISESILSAFFAHKKKRILVIDFDDFYSGTLKAFHVRDLTKLSANMNSNKIQKDSLFRNFQFISDRPEEFSTPEECIDKMRWRGYSFEWDPKMIVSDGKATNELISISVDDYVNFRGLKDIFVRMGDSGQLLSLPLQKSSILSSKGLSLLEKKKVYDIIMTLQKVFVGCFQGKSDINSINELEKDIYESTKSDIVQIAKTLLDKDFKELFLAVENHLFRSKMIYFCLCFMEKILVFNY
jgi:RAB protein geranylgeranyltransferase component A